MRCVHRRVRWYSCHRRCPAKYRSVGAKVGYDYERLAYIKVALIFRVIWKALSRLLMVRRTLGVVSADLIDEIGIDLVVRRTRVHDGGGCHS